MEPKIYIDQNNGLAMARGIADRLKTQFMILGMTTTNSLKSGSLSEQESANAKTIIDFSADTAASLTVILKNIDAVMATAKDAAKT